MRFPEPNRTQDHLAVLETWNPADPASTARIREAVEWLENESGMRIDDPVLQGREDVRELMLAEAGRRQALARIERAGERGLQEAQAILSTPELEALEEQIASRTVRLKNAPPFLRGQRNGAIDAGYEALRKNDPSLSAREAEQRGPAEETDWKLWEYAAMFNELTLTSVVGSNRPLQNPSPQTDPVLQKIETEGMKRKFQREAVRERLHAFVDGIAEQVHTGTDVAEAAEQARARVLAEAEDLRMRMHFHGADQVDALVQTEPPLTVDALLDAYEAKYGSAEMERLSTERKIARTRMVRAINEAAEEAPASNRKSPLPSEGTGSGMTH